MNGHKYKGKKLHVHYASANTDPLKNQNKRGRDDGRDSRDSRDGGRDKRARRDDGAPASTLPLWEQLSDRVTPLWREEYPRQLVRKKRILMDKFKKVFKNYTKQMHQMPAWLQKEGRHHKGMLCAIDNVRPSPVLDGYRNKCEFTVGLCSEPSADASGTAAAGDGAAAGAAAGKSTITVGHLLGLYKDGLIRVVEPTKCKHISEATNRCRAMFQSFVQASSLPPYNKATHNGVWRSLTVRTTTANEVMAIVVAATADVTEVALAREVASLKAWAKKCNDEGLNVASLVLSKNNSPSGTMEQQDSIETIYVASHITETMNGSYHS